MIFEVGKLYQMKELTYTVYALNAKLIDGKYELIGDGAILIKPADIALVIDGLEYDDWFIGICAEHLLFMPKAAFERIE